MFIKKKYFYVKDYKPGFGHYDHVAVSGSYRQVLDAWNNDKRRGNIFRKGVSENTVIYSNPSTTKIKKNKFGQVVSLKHNKKPRRNESEYVNPTISFAIKQYEQGVKS